MRLLILLSLLSSGLLLMGAGTESPLDIDPNTKIQGGADVRGSGANAGADAQSEKKPTLENEKRDEIARPDARSDEKDKPISERKPRERESEDASRGETKLPQQ
jgi:hypothetical protein